MGSERDEARLLDLSETPDDPKICLHMMLAYRMPIPILACGKRARGYYKEQSVIACQGIADFASTSPYRGHRQGHSRRGRRICNPSSVQGPRLSPLTRLGHL